MNPQIDDKQRLSNLEKRGFNILNLQPSEVPLDLFSDVPHRPHGVAARAGAATQWDARDGDLAALATGIYGPGHYLAVGKGRAAETALAAAILKPGAIVVGHPLFMTTGRALADRGAKVEVVPRRPGGDETADVELAWLGKRLAAGDVNVVYLEANNNQLGGLPMRLDNFEAAAGLARKHGATVVLDATRLLANCAALGGDLLATAKAFVQHADAMASSAAKELLVPFGGFVMTRDHATLRRAWEHAFMVGLLLDQPDQQHALAMGMERIAREPDTVAHRGRQLRRIADALDHARVPYLRPLGGHALFLTFTPEQLAGGPSRMRSLEVLLYRLTGIRAYVWPNPVAPGNVAMRITLPIGALTDDQVAAVGPGIATFFARIGEAPPLVEAPHDELSPRRGHFQPAQAWA